MNIIGCCIIKFIVNIKLINVHDVHTQMSQCKIIYVNPNEPCLWLED